MASIEETAKNINDIVIEPTEDSTPTETAVEEPKKKAVKKIENPYELKKDPKDITIRDLLEAGLHFGHQTKRWNPKMRRYIFDKRNGIHVIDLSKSLTMLHESLEYIYDVVANGKSVLFVGTKKQAQQTIKETAINLKQHYVTHRWLGGTLTNSTTIRKSIMRMREIEEMQKNDVFGSNKKEASRMRREHEKLSRNLGGVADMVESPGVIFIVDINRESIAVKEANKLGIPVISIVDTNCNPDPIDMVIPGNDDSIRSIKLVVSAIAKTIEKASAEYEKAAAEIARKKAKIAAEKEAKVKAKAKAEAEAKKVAKKDEATKSKAEEKKRTDAKKATKKADTKDKPKAKTEKPAKAETKKEESKPADKADDKKPAAKKPVAKKTDDKKPAKKAAKPAAKADDKKKDTSKEKK